MLADGESFGYRGRRREIRVRPCRAPLLLLIECGRNRRDSAVILQIEEPQHLPGNRQLISDQLAQPVLGQLFGMRRLSDGRVV